MTDNELRTFITKYREALSELCGADAAYFQGDPNVDAIMELITIAVEQDITINRQKAEIEGLIDANDRLLKRIPTATDVVDIKKE